MIAAKKEEQKDILEFLAPHVEECLYLYLDIYWYGIESDTIKVWYEKKGEDYALVVMKYQSCFQVYSPDNEFDVDAFLALAKEEQIDRVFAKKSTIEKLEPYFKDNFIAEYGQVLELTKHRHFGDMYDRIEEATVEDLPEVVDLLMTDEENALAYSREELYDTLKSLLETKMGRSFFLREDGKIVAHVGISAETDIFMIGAYTMVHKDYRNTLYGMVMDSYLNLIVRGDKRLFGFVVEPRRIKMFQALGNKVVAEYGKLIKTS